MPKLLFNIIATYTLLASNTLFLSAKTTIINSTTVHPFASAFVSHRTKASTLIDTYSIPIINSTKQDNLTTKQSDNLKTTAYSTKTIDYKNNNASCSNDCEFAADEPDAKRNKLSTTKVQTSANSNNSTSNPLLNETDNYINNTVNLTERFLTLYPIEIWKANGWFTDDYVYIINTHWLQFHPSPNFVHYILGTLYIFVALMGYTGNLIVLVLFFRRRSLRTPANTLVINLAISDILMVSKMPLFIFNSFNLGPAIGHTGCIIYGFIGGLTGTVSISTLACISIDRYYVVVYPLNPLRRTTKLRARICVVVAWIYGITFSILPVVKGNIVGNYVPEGLLTSCSFDYLSKETPVKIFILSFFVAAWVLPLTIIVFCYANILKVVIDARDIGKNMQTTGTEASSSRHFKEQEKRRTEVKLAGVIMCVIALWFVAWTPYAIVALLGIFGQADLITPLASMIPALSAKLVSSIDPYLYALTHPKFKTEFKSFILRQPVERRGTEKQVTTTMATEAKAATLKRSRRGTDASESDVEEVVVMVNVPPSKDVTKTSSSTPKKGIGLSTVTPVNNHIPTISAGAEDLKDSENYRPPSWFAKPDFCRRQSSLKIIANRIGSLKKDPTANSN